MAGEDVERAAALAWLASRAGQSLLATASELPDDRLTRITRLRRLAPAPIAAYAVELLELRKRAGTKFQHAERMAFTPDGLEQSTGDAIAAYRAGLFPEGAAVLDACCGIGGDARWLAERGPVIAVDHNPAAAICTRWNSALGGAKSGGRWPVWTLCADVCRLALARFVDGGVAAALFDPSRRASRFGGGRRRIRDPKAYSPPLSWVTVLREVFPIVCAKVSPAIDDDAIAHLGGRVEFISDRGECKEAALWFGPSAEPLPLPPAAREPYFATILRPGSAPATLGPFECPALASGSIGEILYEPDPAVIRSHLVPQLAALLGAAAVEHGVAYLSAPTHSDTPFASAFRVVDTMPYNPKEIQRRLRFLGGHVYAVKKRGVPIDPQEVIKGLSPEGDRALVMLLTRRAGRIVAILCERLKSTSVPDPD